MATQSFENHKRMVPGFHYVTFTVWLLTFIGAAMNLYQSWGTPAQYGASLIVVIMLLLWSALWYLRMFALGAQDRAIRAEEHVRYLELTGKPLPAKLTKQQIIALRFASDAEFPSRAERAAAENMSPNDIKKAIQSWRADNDRI